MVLLGRIELPTSPLPRVRSTTELQQQDHVKAPAASLARPAGGRHWLSGGLLSSARGRGNALAMGDEKYEPTREERLAAQLRENLRRRKTQARALDRKDDGLPKAPERG